MEMEKDKSYEEYMNFLKEKFKDVIIVKKFKSSNKSITLGLSNDDRIYFLYEGVVIGEITPCKDLNEGLVSSIYENIPRSTIVIYIFEEFCYIIMIFPDPTVMVSKSKKNGK